MSQLVTVIGWVIAVVGLPTLFTVWAVTRIISRLRLGKKVRGAAKFTRDVTIAAAAAAALSRLVFGPRWKRIIAALFLASAWLFVWTYLPSTRWVICVAAPFAALVAVYSLAAYWQWKFNLWGLPLLGILREGRRRKHTTRQAVASVQRVVGHEGDKPTSILRDHWQDDEGRDVYAVEPPPGRTVEQVIQALTERRVDSALSQALRRVGVAGETETRRYVYLGRQDLAIIFAVDDRPAPPPADHTAGGVTWAQVAGQ